MTVAPYILILLLGQAAAVETPARLLGAPGQLIQLSDYPTLALIDDIEGATGFSVKVGPDGRVSKCSVTASSGSASLDSATCALITRRARFAPATRAGVAVPGEWKSRVRWNLAGQYLVVDPRVDGPARISAIANEAFRQLSVADALRSAGLESQPASTTIEVDIDRGGTVAACKVAQSTASALHTSFACPLLMGKDLFIPGFDRDGNAEPDRARVKIRW